VLNTIPPAAHVYCPVSVEYHVRFACPDSSEFCLLWLYRLRCALLKLYPRLPALAAKRHSTTVSMGCLVARILPNFSVAPMTKTPRQRSPSAGERPRKRTHSSASRNVAYHDDQHAPTCGGNNAGHIERRNMRAQEWDPAGGSCLPIRCGWQRPYATAGVSLEQRNPHSIVHSYSPAMPEVEWPLGACCAPRTPLRTTPPTLECASSR
jgi:hypothetical protein